MNLKLKLPAAAVCCLALVSGCSRDTVPEQAPTPVPTLECKDTPPGFDIPIQWQQTSSKPEIPKPEGTPPTDLVCSDVVEGDGEQIALNDSITVDYVGVTWASGAQFDASWDRGTQATFGLAKGRLIDGWTIALPGMKVGGRRLLIIPPELAYGEASRSAEIPPNSTLIFVIDIRAAVKPAATGDPSGSTGKPPTGTGQQTGTGQPTGTAP